MSNSQPNEQEDLQKYLAEKAKQAQSREQEAEPLSAYEACVLKESARMKELITQSKK